MVSRPVCASRGSVADYDGAQNEIISSADKCAEQKTPEHRSCIACPPICSEPQRVRTGYKFPRDDKSELKSRTGGELRPCA